VLFLRKLTDLEKNLTKKSVQEPFCDQIEFRLISRVYDYVVPGVAKIYGF
jgi:hypothetical protein